MLKTLRAATFDVLETMFFLFPEPPDDMQLDFSGPGLRASVPVSGPQPFAVGVAVPVGLARQMGANFLGQAPDDILPAALEDLVRELANMIVGSFLVRSRASAAFHLHPPLVERLELEPRPAREHVNQLFLAVEDYGMEVFLELTPHPAPRNQAAPA